MSTDIEFITNLIDEYIRDNAGIISDPEFESILLRDVKSLCGITEDPDESEDTLDDAHIIDDPLYEGLYCYYLYFMPRRSFDTSFTYKNLDIQKITTNILKLNSKPQPIQRSPEWYSYRRNVITASNLYKTFGSQAVQNELILEKCNSQEGSSFGSTNTSSSLHWGVKYEPLSVMIYEEMYSTKIHQLGCITHDTHSFIGASPDGINGDPTSTRYGRLLEIKNVKSREIDGTICEPYWIQIQVQLEVCDIEDCDYLETKFVEYDTYTDYISDDLDMEELDEDEYEYNYVKQTKSLYKGIIIYFHKPGEPPTYEYKPLAIKDTLAETAWETSMIVEYTRNGYQWITNTYWKLVVFNCQLVLRNRLWFSYALPHVASIWDTILAERTSGYSHRRPNSRTKKIDQLA